MDSVNAASADSQKKSSSLLSRVISALVLIPLILGLSYWSYWSIVALVLLASIIAVREIAGLLSHAGYVPRLRMGMAVGIGIVVATAVQPFVQIFDTVELALMLAIAGSLVAELPRHDGQNALASWALTLAGSLYFSWLASHFILLRAIVIPLVPGPLSGLHIPPGAAWICLVLAITWLQDSAAYFVGKRWGRTKLAPALSPKKTWEGAIGGTIASILGAVLAAWVFGLPLSLWAAALLGVIGAVVGPLGDLAESFIKRQVGMKDAGNLIPGHGGVLDRADSLIFVAAVLYYLIPLFAGR